MAQKIIVDCDLCGTVLEDFELQKMSEIGIVYREVGNIEYKGNMHEIIKSVENYSIQFCKKCAPEFLEKLKQLVVRK